MIKSREVKEMKEKVDNKMNPSVIINAVDRTLDVIEYLHREDRGVSISQISKDLNLYKSTVYRTLATLENRGYVEQNEESELYSLGPKFYTLSGGTDAGKKLFEYILPYMQKLNDKYGDAVNLAMLDRTGDIYRIVIIGECSSKYSLGASVNIGAMDECYCASLGKCLLAFSKDIDLSVYNGRKMERFTDTTIATVDGLRKELDKIKDQGYSLDNEEREVGLFCVGVPIMQNGHAVAAVSISGPTRRIRDDNLEGKIEFMKELSEEIARAIFV